MSTIAATQTALPTGTWNIDPVHSQVGFAVEYMVGTFRGSFSPVEGTLAVGEDGAAELTGSARGDEHQGAGREPRHAPALAPSSSTPSARRRSRSPPPTSSATATT